MKYPQYIKKTTLIILFFCNILMTYAQKATLKVGDKAPPITAFKWVKGEPIKKFKKGQIYVVEFGATWCGPCKKAIPQLTALQKKYGDKITVIGNFIMEANKEPLNTKNPKYVKIVENYVERMGDDMQYHVAVDVPEKTTEKQWVRAAGLTGIPKTFVVDREGYIAWIGYHNVDKLIDQMLSGHYNLNDQIQLAQTKEKANKKNKESIEAFIRGTSEDEEYLYRSVLQKFKGKDLNVGHTPWYIWGYSHKPDDFDHKKHSRIVGMNLRHLYALAYRDTLEFRPWYNKETKQLIPNCYATYVRYPVLEVSDFTPFDTIWQSPKEKWNYSLTVPKEKATAKFLQAAMRRDLQTYFGYDVQIENRKMPYWRITCAPELKEKLKTKTPGAEIKYTNSIIDNRYATTITNTNMPHIIYQFWLNNQRDYPFVDETGIKGDMDIVLTGAKKGEEELYSKNLRSRGEDRISPATIRMWEEAGLKIEKAYKDFKVVVIRDTLPEPETPPTVIIP